MGKGSDNMSKKQVELFFILKGYPRVSETFITQEIHLLEELGYKITIISMRKAREKKLQPINEKVKAHVQYMPEYIIRDFSTVLSLNFVCFLKYPLDYLKGFFSTAFKSLLRFDKSPSKRFLQAAWVVGKMKFWNIKDHAYLHAHFAHTPADVAFYISNMTGLPFSISAHAKDIYTFPESDLIEKIRASEFLTTCTKFNYDFMHALAPDLKSKVFKNYHGISSLEFSPVKNFQVDKKNISFFSIGRLVLKKGYPVIFNALKTLKDKGYVFKYTIFGAGELETEYRALVKDLGLEDSVNFFLVATHPQIIGEIEKSPGIFLCGSVISGDGDRDGIPNTVAEAMSLELPVLATKVSGIPEIIEDGKDGFLVDSEDSQAMASKLMEMIENPVLLEKVRKAGRLKVKSMFESKELIFELSDLLERSISQKIDSDKFYLKAKPKSL